MPSHSDALSLIRDTLALLKEDPLILSSPEDAQYFRTLAKRKSAPPPQQPKSSPPPPSPPKLEFPPPPAPEPKSSPPPVAVTHPAPKIEPPLPRIEAPTYSSFTTQRSTFSKVAPDIQILDEIPSDAIAKKIATRWKTKNQTAPISILSLSEPPLQKTLLEEIAKALDVYFGPAKLLAAEPIEKEKQWEAFLSVADLKLVIACDYTLWQLSDLMRHYRETPDTPAKSTRMLKNTPLFLLPDLSLYLKDPLLKRSLWRALCQKLST